MAKERLKIEYVPLDEIAGAERNPKDHDIGAIIESMRRFGFVEPGVRNEATGRIVAGHGRRDALIAMRESGDDPPDRVRVNGSGVWMVPVIAGVSFASDEEAEAYLVAANRLTEIGGWNDAELVNVLQALGEHDPDLLAVTGYDDDDLRALLAGMDETPDERPEDKKVYAVEELKKKWKTKRGQLWTIRSVFGVTHRLLIGDAADPDDAARLYGSASPRLMLTDPPYGVSLGETAWNPKQAKPGFIENDDLRGDDLAGFIATSLGHVCERMPKGAVVYCWSAPLAEGASMLRGIMAAGFHVQSQLVWVKPQLILGQADYQWRHEVCWYGYKKGGKRTWKGGRTKTTILDFKRDNDQPHPTQKPLALFTDLIHASSVKGDVIVDPFLGSGTTMAAADHCGDATVLGMEIDPGFAAVALERMADRGLTCERVDDDG